MIASISRPTLAHVDLTAIKDNIKAITASLPKDVKRLVVVKANAYGHGSVAVAQAVEQDVDGFCVSNLDEALELRQAGIKCFILVLGVVPPEQVRQAIAHQLTLTVASLEWLDLVREMSVDLSGLSCHVKVDSGMGRLGLTEVSSVNCLITQLEVLSVKVTGIFTHFATADESSQVYFEEQLARFKTVLAHLDKVPQMVHISNSATSIWHADTVFKAVRLGIASYGLNPSGSELELPMTLKPALSLTSQLIHVKKVAKGQTIGYGATYQTAEDEWIGTVPIGYADGWVRRMQGFSVLIDGQYCEIVGRVSMDQLTIRLSKSYPMGTKVTLIGRDGDYHITATDVAQHIGTINYEVLCLLSDRVPRCYD